MSEKEIKRVEKEVSEGRKELFERYWGQVNRYGKEELVAFNGLGRRGLGRKLIRWKIPEIEVEVNTKIFKVMIFTEPVFKKVKKEAEAGSLSVSISLKQKDDNLVEVLTLDKSGGHSIWRPELPREPSHYFTLSQYAQLCDSLEKELAKKRE